MNCQLCNGDLVTLGSLGRHRWSRCRACGMEFSTTREADVFGDFEDELDDDTDVYGDDDYPDYDTDDADEGRDDDDFDEEDNDE